MGTVRGFLSVLICSFFWIILLYPKENAPTAPARSLLPAHAGVPGRSRRTRFMSCGLHRFCPGSCGCSSSAAVPAVIAYVLITDPQRLSARLTPNPAEITQWPVLLGCLAGGFGIALFVAIRPGPAKPDVHDDPGLDRRDRHAAACSLRPSSSS